MLFVFLWEFSFSELGEPCTQQPLPSPVKGFPDQSLGVCVCVAGWRGGGGSELLSPRCGRQLLLGFPETSGSVVEPQLGKVPWRSAGQVCLRGN